MAALEGVPPFVQIVDIKPPVAVGKGRRCDRAFNLKCLIDRPQLYCFLQSQHALGRSDGERQRSLPTPSQLKSHPYPDRSVALHRLVSPLTTSMGWAPLQGKRGIEAFA